jgi:D-arabinose 1-dehydrogenase-like Zn-dependent alcohol dehydrogenase
MTVEYMQFVEAHGIKPPISKTFDFKDMVEAMETLAKGSEVGKIVIKIGNEE